MEENVRILSSTVKISKCNIVSEPGHWESV
jgi:hypothetical protein